MNNQKPIVLGGIGEKKSNNGTQWYQQDRIYDNNIAISITTSFNPYYKEEKMNNLRIRKLTPKECWRLMGFDDSDFEKAEKVNSNTQLYKQAGNSIVVNVLERILENLLDKDEYIKILELFGGIGACSKALERIGTNYEIADYVEIDKYAVKSFNSMHDTNFEPQDICKWDKNIECDLIMHGSPCQDFSLAGKQAGGDEGSGTRSSLMYETIRIVEKLKPKYVIWENVKNVISKKHRHNFDNYLNKMEDLGYTNYYQVLNAKDYGIPQNRERVFTISILGNENFEFPPKQELKLKLKDMLENEVDEKYYLSEKALNYVLDMNDVQVGTKWEGSTSKGSINKPIAMTIGCRSAVYQRAGITNYVVDDYDDEMLVSELKLKIRNATKQGYLEAYPGDGVDISSRMQYHRGNVQKQSIQTITTSGGNDRGVVIENKFPDLD